MIFAFLAITAVNAGLWAFVLRDWSKFRQWMEAEDQRDAASFRGLGQLRTEMQQARDELADARARLDWAVDELIERMGEVGNR